jgi:hypothetical protein
MFCLPSLSSDSLVDRVHLPRLDLFYHSTHEHASEGERIWAAQFMRLKVRYRLRIGDMSDVTEYRKIFLDNLPDFSHGTLGTSNERQYAADILGLMEECGIAGSQGTELGQDSVTEQYEFPYDNDPVETMTKDDWGLFEDYVDYFTFDDSDQSE